MSKVFIGPKTEATWPEEGRGQVASGGVADYGTREEDGPETWEAPVLLGEARCNGDPVTTLRRNGARGTRARSGEEEASLPR